MWILLFYVQRNETYTFLINHGDPTMITRSRGPVKDTDHGATSTTSVPVRRRKRQRIASVLRETDQGTDSTTSAPVPEKKRQRIAPLSPGAKGQFSKESTSAATTSSLSTSQSLIYDVKVPITQYGLLIMLKSLTTNNLVFFDGYSKLPNGQEGPAETQKLFKNKGDIIIAINGCQVKGLTVPSILDLIKRYVSQRVPSNEESLTITFKMMTPPPQFSATIATIPPPPPPQVPKIVVPKTPACGKDAMFWKSTDAAKLFGFTVGDDVFKGLEERIKLLRKGNATVDGWKCVVQKDVDNIIDLYTDDDILIVRHKCMFLIKAYTLALKHCFVKTFSKCIEEACAAMGDLGVIFGIKKIIECNIDFRTNQFFSHPPKLLKTPPKPPHLQLLESFPFLRDMITEFAYTYKGLFLGSSVRNEIVKRMLPECKRQSELKGCFNDGSKGQQILQEYLEKPPSQRVINRLMHHMEIEWDFWCILRSTALGERMRQAWTEGKYANLRPRGKVIAEEVLLGDDNHGDDNNKEPSHDDKHDDNNTNRNIYRNLLAVTTNITTTPSERLKQAWADGVYANRKYKPKGVQNETKASDVEEVPLVDDKYDVNDDDNDDTYLNLLVATATTTNL